MSWCFCDSIVFQLTLSLMNVLSICILIVVSVILFFSASRGIPHTAGLQRESSVKTLHSPLFAEFWRHCVLSGRTQRRALPWNQSVGFTVTLCACKKKKSECKIEWLWVRSPLEEMKYFTYYFLICFIFSWFSYY